MKEPLRTGNVAAGVAAAEDGFARMLSLAGTWEGKLEDGSQVQLTFQPISGGTALLETLQFANGSSMTTVYHRDGDKTMATHYCMGNNQPRLVATNPSENTNLIEFHFLDATNLGKQAHLNDYSFELIDANQMNVTAKFKGENHVNQIQVQYTRKK